MDYLLDTNIVLIYLRQSGLKEELDRRLSLFSPENTLLISVVSIGEAKSIAIQRKWGEKKIVQLEGLLKKLLIADINAKRIIERYAEIDAYSQGKLENKRASFTSRNMGKNDLWIASTASILNAKLITTDKDFRHLDQEYIDLLEIDLDEIKSKIKKR
ncbi:MAG: PIN domain-containing protein [Lewinellaceae bacterium]|nr:PIN domain-containing protein [Phaeodactylibacter sp.]MCB9036228.1 PIN domain-containing protein [Lewinellaceae bacterium]